MRKSFSFLAFRSQGDVRTESQWGCTVFCLVSTLAAGTMARVERVGRPEAFLKGRAGVSGPECLGREN